MSFAPNPVITASGADDPLLDYLWDDTRASEDFRTDASDVVARAGLLTLRARIALGIGIYEWIVFRFSAVSDDPQPSQIAQAAWCACIDRKYMEYLELERTEWLGPVRGPLWCATTWLLPMVFFSDDEPAEWQSGVDYLTRLARHVLNDSNSFLAWLDASLLRLAALYPATPDDPFTDLFSEHEEERRGPLVPREALDTSTPFRIEDTEQLIERFLAEALRSDNPLVVREFKRPFPDHGGAPSGT